MDTEYIAPITVFFGKESQTLLSEVVEVKPSPFKIYANTDGRSVTLSKTTLNAGDSVTVKALVTKLACVFVSGRISGGKIEQSIPTTQTPNFWLKMAVVVELISLAGIGITAYFNQVLVSQFFALIFLIDVGLAIFYMILQFLKFIYSKLRYKKT